MPASSLTHSIIDSVLSRFLAKEPSTLCLLMPEVGYLDPNALRNEKTASLRLYAVTATTPERIAFDNATSANELRYTIDDVPGCEHNECFVRVIDAASFVRQLVTVTNTDLLAIASLDKARYVNTTDLDFASRLIEVARLMCHTDRARVQLIAQANLLVDIAQSYASAQDNDNARANACAALIKLAQINRIDNANDPVSLRELRRGDPLLKNVRISALGKAYIRSYSQGAIDQIKSDLATPQNTPSQTENIERVYSVAAQTLFVACPNLELTPTEQNQSQNYSAMRCAGAGNRPRHLLAKERILLFLENRCAHDPNVILTKTQISNAVWLCKGTVDRSITELKHKGDIIVRTVRDPTSAGAIGSAYSLTENGRQHLKIIHQQLR